MRDEQLEELEAIQAIYPDDYKLLIEDPVIKFTLKVRSDDEDASDHITMEIKFPDTYPEVIPEIMLSSATGVPRSLLNELTDTLNNTANDNIGMIMVFQIYSDCKDWLENYIQTNSESKQKAIEAQKKIDEANAKKRHGTMVTKDNFLVWRERFEVEMLEKERREAAELAAQLAKKGGKGAKDTKYNKLTGKEIFERGSDSKTTVEGSEGKTIALEVDESLFEDEVDELESNSD